MLKKLLLEYFYNGDVFEIVTVDDTNTNLLEIAYNGDVYAGVATTLTGATTTTTTTLAPTTTTTTTIILQETNYIYLNVVEIMYRTTDNYILLTGGTFT